MTKRVIVMLAPSPASRGGMASVIRNWQAAGVFDRWPIEFLATHVEGSRLRKSVIALRAWMRLLALLARHRVALVHAHVPRRRAFWRKALFVLTARIAGCPYVLHMHSGGFPAFYYAECSARQKRMVRWVLDGAAAIIVLSNQWRDWLAPITVNTRITRVSNFVEVPADAAHPGEPRTVLFIGRLSEEKGFFDLLRAVRLVATTFPDLRVVCGGEGDLVRAHAFIHELKLDENVALPGWIDDDARALALRDAAVLVLPSYAEGVPMSVLEAMAVGVPVVATRVGGVPEILEDNVEGLLVEAGDIHGLAQALTMLLSNAERRAAMGAAARARVLHEFTAQTALTPLEKLYIEYGVNPRSDVRTTNCKDPSQSGRAMNTFQVKR